MYLNSANINLINAVKKAAQARGLTFTQTNSRLNGAYLDACRIYRTAADKGKPRRAIWTGTEPADFTEYLEGE